LSGTAFLLVAVAASTSTGYAQSKITLDDYSCADFLSDARNPADGGKLLRSMTMISWATGYAAAHQEGIRRSDSEAMQLIANIVGDACRNNPNQLATQAAVDAIARYVNGAEVNTSNNGKQEDKQQAGIAPKQAKPSLDEAHDAKEVGRLNPVSVAQGTFNAYDNFDMFGGDLRKIPKIELKACIAACGADRECRAYSFDRWNRYCYLKSTANALTFDPSSTTGLRADSDNPGFSKVEYRIDRRANKSLEGSSSVKAGIAGVEDCDRSCVADKACFGFTFEKPRAVCRIFSAISTFKPDRGATSGIKTQSPP
jgi:PAN domain/HdeA/HdeB family